MYKGGLFGEFDGIGVVVGGLVVIWMSIKQEKSLSLSENDLWLGIANFEL